MRVENSKKRKKKISRIAGLLAAVLVLSEICVDISYAAQPIGEAELQEESVAVREDESKEESSTVTETGEEPEEGNTATETEEEPEEDSTAAETEEKTEEEGSTVAGTEEVNSTVDETEESTLEEPEEDKSTLEETEKESEEESDVEEVAEAAGESQLDYIYGRELTEEEIAAQQALEPACFPEMEVFEFPEEGRTQQNSLYGISSVTLEESYDARELGILNAIRNQGQWGTCWSFATLGIMESALIKEETVAQGGMDLSERHLAYFVGHTGYDELGNAEGDTITTSPQTYYLDKGGNFYYASMKLMNWQGGAAEESFPYINSSTVPDLETEEAQNDVAHIENCYWLSTKANDKATIQAVKTMIKQYGCVAWSYYHNKNYLNYSTSAYYNYVNSSTNHAIMVVGWDDTYSKNNFGTEGDTSTQPVNDGAWIVRNSWGSEWGDGGYFYISYEDTSLGSGNGAAAMTANLADDYDNNYFYGNTATFYCRSGFSKAAQIYQIKGKDTEKEQIRAVSFMLWSSNIEYSIQIYKNPELVDGVVTNPESGEAMLEEPVSGTTTYAGLYTINLPSPIILSTDDYAAVVITFPNKDAYLLCDYSRSSSSGSSVWNEVNKTVSGQSLCKDGSGYWTDLHSNGESFRINMLTDDVEEPLTTPVINNITITEPDGFDASVKYTIRWSKCSNATGYEVYRSESEEGTYTNIGSAGSDKRFYTDAVEKSNWSTKYYYKVRAVFDESVWEDSEPMAAQAEGILRTILNSAGYSDEKITIIWQAMDGAEGYRIERKEKDEAEYRQIADITNQSTTSYVDDVSTLPLGYYEYRVQAYTTGEEAEWSTVKTVVSNLKMTPVSHCKVKFEWLPVEYANKYTLFVVAKEGNYKYTTSWKLDASKFGDSPEYTLDISGARGFKTGERLESYVKALNADSQMLSTTQTVYYNTKPDPLSCGVSYSEGTVHFSWTGGTGSDAIYIYRSMDADKQGDEPYTVITDTSVLAFNDNTFSEPGTYYYWVYPGVTNASGQIIYGEPFAHEQKIEPAVQITEVAQQSEESLKITWNAVNGAESYSVYRRVEGQENYTLLADNVISLEYTDSTVITGKTYYYKVQFHAAGEASLLINTAPERGRTVPETPVLSDVTYNKILIKNNSSFSYAIGEEGSQITQLKFTDSTESVICFNGLKPESTYSIYVRTKQEITGEEPVYGSSLKVTTAEYPIDETDMLSAVEEEVEIEAYHLNENSSHSLQIQNQDGVIQNAEMFEFVSDNPKVCLVNADGTVVPNPTFNGKTDTKVKIIAKAVDDPVNREVVFGVTVLTQKYVSRLEIEKVGSSGENLETEKIDTFWGKKFVKGDKLTFRAVAYDAGGVEISQPNLSWSLSDTSIASLKTNRDGTITLTLKKAGRVNLTCKSKDGRQKKKVIQIGALVTEPVISTKQVTLNKKLVGDSGLKKSTTFTISARNGAIEKLPEITEIKTGKKVLTEDTGFKHFHMLMSEDGSYHIGIEDEFLEKIKNNTVYTITVKTEINGIPEIGITEPVSESFKITLKVISKEPTVTVKASGINRIYVQEEDLTGLLTIKAPDDITGVRVLDAEEGQINNFDSYFHAVEKEGQWYLQFKDLTNNYNKKSISGKLEIAISGYEPVVKKVTVKTTSSLPVVKQQTIPVIHTGISDSVSVSLFNSTEKKVFENFEIQGVESDVLEAEKAADGTVTLSVKDTAQYKDGATLKAVLNIMAVGDKGCTEWKSPLTVTVKVKAYHKKVPTVSMKSTKFTLNRQISGENAETSLSINCANVSVLPESEWLIFAYNSKTRKYDLQGPGITDWFHMTYDEESGMVIVGFASQSDAMMKGNYKFRLCNFVEGFDTISKDFTIKVIDEAPVITVKTSGKLDLLKREDVTLNGKLTLKNIPSKVVGVTIQNADRTGENEYYQSSLLNRKQFKISMTAAGLEAPMTTGKVILPVEVELKGGQKIQTTMTFKPVQSTPVIKVPSAKILYKSIPGCGADYDLTAGQTKGTKIKRIELVKVPEGIDVMAKEGHLFVKLSDRGIKKGSYKVKVNIYFEGAQAVGGNEDGKPVVKTVTVKVAE